MAVKTWDTSRVGGGTYELHRDATTGNYSLKSVGFDQVNKLNLPDLASQDKNDPTIGPITKLPVEPKLKDPYEKLASANLGGDTQQDYSKIPFTGGVDRGTDNIATGAWDTGQWGPKPGDTTGDGPWTMRSEGGQFPGRSRIDPTEQWRSQVSGNKENNEWRSNAGGIEQGDDWSWKDYVYMGDDNTSERFQGANKIYKDMDAETASLLPGLSEKDVASVKTSEFPGRSKTIGGRDIREFPGRSKTIGGKDVRATDSKALGIDTTAPTTGGSQWVKDTISNPRDPNYSGWIQKSVMDKHIADKKAKLARVSKIPIIGTIARIGSAIGDMLPRSTDTQKFNKDYFNVRGGSVDSQRITRSQYVDRNGNLVTSSGNPANDLYAGMNRTSAFGNLERAGSKRIATREATIARRAKTNRPMSQKFIDDTERMKDQQKDYQKQKNKRLVKKAVEKGASTKNPAEMRAATGGDDKGSDSGRVICTELHRTKEMATHDWIRDIKFTYNNLSKDHIKGYLFWAVPTVKHIQKYPTYRKIWKHLAQHRANDIAWRLNQGKFDLLGRIYAGIGEPLCWLIGKCVSDKQLKELKLNSWRRA